VNRGEAGHRILPHTADLLIEAWGPSRARCFEEAVRALVSTFVDVVEVPASEPVSISIDAGADNEMLAAVLDEILFLADVSGRVPIHLTLEESEDGGLAGVLDVIAIDGLDVVGPLPKGASYGGEVAESGGLWHCRVVVDI